MAEKKFIGLDIEPPEKKCEDANCPWHGQLSIRGRVFEGTVKSARAHNTAVVKWNFYHFVTKYERYERKHTTVIAHNPPCISAKEEESVVIAECRPLSKAKQFVILGRAAEKKEAGKPAAEEAEKETKSKGRKKKEAEGAR